jgi:hypothetical protein
VLGLHGELQVEYTNVGFDSFSHWIAEMYSSVTNRRLIAIWLSAILFVLSVAASAHSVEHIDESAKTHCTFCFHQHQFDHVLPQQDANFEFISPQYETMSIAQPSLALLISVSYLSRAPPAFF